MQEAELVCKRQGSHRADRPHGLAGFSRLTGLSRHSRLTGITRLTELAGLAGHTGSPGYWPGTAERLIEIRFVFVLTFSNV